METQIYSIMKAFWHSPSVYLLTQFMFVNTEQRPGRNPQAMRNPEHLLLAEWRSGGRWGAGGVLGRSESSVKWGPLASLSPGSSEIRNVVSEEGKGLGAVLSLPMLCCLMSCEWLGALLTFCEGRTMTEQHPKPAASLSHPDASKGLTMSSSFS